ncbi:unnamed protein product [Sphenostylis stenocarpa]|uniref:DNA-directed RNA polymerase n=1 Tax=Sphenostylis stenocarpa TaxID=92480 RepID=A0AA86VGH6_9FABA|nr:unnamed protein product [Sphenostylis stenocarpa]
MWTKFAKRASSTLRNNFFRVNSLSPRFIEPQTSTKLNPYPCQGFARVGVSRSSFLFYEGFSSPSLLVVGRGHATVAEAVESTDTEDDYDEVRKLLEEMAKAEQKLDCSSYKYKMLKRRQIKMETEAWEDAAREYEELLEDMREQKLAPNLPYMKSLFLGWFEPLKNAILADQELCKGSKCRLSHGPYFNHLPADMMAVVTMHKLMALLMTNSNGVGTARVIQAACQVGEAVEHEARIYQFMKREKRTAPDKSSHLAPSGQRGKVSEENEEMEKKQNKLRKRVAALMKKQKKQQAIGVVRGQDDWKPWGQEAQAKVCDACTSYIQPPANQFGDGPPDIRPAFQHSLKTLSNELQKETRRYGVIECDPLVQNGLEKSARHMVIPYMPMLVPPINWTGYDKGAYFFLPSYVMRIHGAKQQREAVKRASKGQLDPVFEALNTLGNTKWRVNKRVLCVIDQIWANGGRLADLVDREDVPLPEEPDTEDEAEIRKWKWKVKAVKKENKERHSQRCDIELKLAVARKMKDEEGFYYPHNLDFRGRAYPMHPYLNHLGSDLCRGILEFAEGRPLGKSGLRWLKIHVANLYAGGVDKLSYDGRIAFTENHLDDIIDSADRPLEGKRWWLQAEDPFQCLAACINLSDALRSPNPETTISYMPVHQDGSCNGLQHYAALGRDKLGAAAVNLVGGDQPADVYSGIAASLHKAVCHSPSPPLAVVTYSTRKNAVLFSVAILLPFAFAVATLFVFACSRYSLLVLEIMKRDAEKDPQTNPNALHARRLISQVDRKLVKQTVMTSVYGVTYIGARDQIKRRLKERCAIEDDVELFAASCYAAKTTLTALEEMFEAARSIMGWLGDCAKVIASTNQAVRWITPLGLPVVQPYRQLGRHLIMAKRHRTAFPPNFVHSLDGSHMMMTAVACTKAGLNFAGVHDSYWTHACDVDEMNRILREKFVELYEAPILENLLESFQKTFPTLNFPPLPERGDFNLQEVLESTYFFN